MLVIYFCDFFKGISLLIDLRKCEKKNLSIGCLLDFFIELYLWIFESDVFSWGNKKIGKKKLVLVKFIYE